MRKKEKIKRRESKTGILEKEERRRMEEGEKAEGEMWRRGERGNGTKRE